MRASELTRLVDSINESIEKDPQNRIVRAHNNFIQTVKTLKELDVYLEKERQSLTAPDGNSFAASLRRKYQSATVGRPLFKKVSELLGIEYKDQATMLQKIPVAVEKLIDDMHKTWEINIPRIDDPNIAPEYSYYWPERPQVEGYFNYIESVKVPLANVMTAGVRESLGLPAKLESIARKAALDRMKKGPRPPPLQL